MSGILFSAVVNTVFVAKLLILGTLFSTAVKSDLLAILDAFGILFSIELNHFLWQDLKL